MSEEFKDPYLVEASTGVNLSPDRVMHLLKQHLPKGREAGSIYSCDTKWELHGDPGKLRWIYLLDGLAPDLGPTLLRVTRVTDLADFRPHTAAHAVHTLDSDATDKNGIVPTFARELERWAMGEDSKTRVLYVARDQEARRQMEHYLRYQFPDVVLTTVATQRDALQTARELFVPFDIVISQFGDKEDFNAVSLISELRKSSDGSHLHAHVFGAPRSVEVTEAMKALGIHRLGDSDYRTVTDAIRRSVSTTMFGEPSLG